MPECLTHYYFAKDVINELDIKYKEHFNYNESRIFLYANMYDLPYYYRLSGILKKDKFNLGYKLHNVKTKEYIEHIIKFIRNNSFDKDNILMLYCLVTHYVLDSIIHPYINSISGIYNKNDKSSKIYRGNHGYIERAIDTILAKKNENISLHKVKLYKKFRSAFIFNFSDLEIINHSIQHTYYFVKPEEYFKISLKNFKKFFKRTAYDKLKIKSVIFKINDCTFNKKSSVVTSNFLYKNNYKDVDYLNINHNVWLHPVTGEANHYSFYELCDIAKKTATDYLEAVNNYLFYNNSKQFKNLFNNLSLDYGFSSKENLKYSSPILPILKK